MSGKISRLWRKPAQPMGEGLPPPDQRAGHAPAEPSPSGRASIGCGLPDLKLRKRARSAWNAMRPTSMRRPPPGAHPPPSGTAAQGEEEAVAGQPGQPHANQGAAPETPAAPEPLLGEAHQPPQQVRGPRASPPSWPGTLDMEVRAVQPPPTLAGGAPSKRSSASASKASAPSPSAALLATLGNALRELGEADIAADDDAVRQILSLDAPVPDSAVAALRLKVLQDPALAGAAQNQLRHYSAEALRVGTKTSADRLLRLELLMLLQTPRHELIGAVRADLERHSEKIKSALLASRGRLLGRTLVHVPMLTIGGGPHGQAIANQMDEAGLAGCNLVVDASSSGDGNFGSVRGHLLNSRTNWGYKGSDVQAMLDDTRSRNPLHGSPIQVEDLNGTPDFPTAADLGDAASLGLYAAARRGAPVMVSTRVAGIEDMGSDKTRRKAGRYRVTLEDASGETYQVSTDRIVDATGFGRPAVPLAHEPSRRYIGEQSARIREKGGAALPGQSVAHSEDLLRAINSADGEQILDFIRKSPGDIVVVGWGDSSRTPLQRIMLTAERHNTRMARLLGPDRKIVWVGAPSDLEEAEDGLPPRSPLRRLFQAGLVRTVGARLQSIAPASAGSPGDSSVLTVLNEDGTVSELAAGRTLLAMGMTPRAPEFLGELAPDFNPDMRVPVRGDDLVYHDDLLGTRLQVGEVEHDIFFAGPSTGLMRPPGASPLDYFGWKTRNLVEQVLLPAVQQDPQQPFAEALSGGPPGTG